MTKPAHVAAASIQPCLPAAAARAAPSRASWCGLLQLSLVTIPVKAYPATTAAPELACHLLHAGCGQRIRYVKQCPQPGPVDSGAIHRGYEYAPDKYLPLDPAELERLRPAGDRALILERFLDPCQIDPILLNGRSLYLAPDGALAKPAYAVLTQVLGQRQKIDRCHRLRRQPLFLRCCPQARSGQRPNASADAELPLAPAAC